MRNANAQREDSMICVKALQQPPMPHVSHAEIGGSFRRAKFATHRCVVRWTIGFERTRISFSAGSSSEILPKPEFG